MVSTVVNLSLILLYAANLAMVTSQCFINKLSDGNPCIGLLTCSDNIESFTLETENWPCMRFDYEGDYIEEENSYIDVDLDNRYSALEIQEFFSYLYDFKTYITSISVRNSAMTSINTLLYDLLNVKNIDLSHNEIHSFALGKFLRLKSLDIVNVSHNAIDNLGTENGTNLSVNSLSVLDLSHNQIVTVPIHYFRDAPQILHLNLSHNSIELFDNLTFEGLPELKTLSLTNNKLTQIGSFIGRLVNLHELRLDFNHLEYLNDMKISALSSLQKLTVSNNKVKYITNALQYAFHLTELDFSYNNIDVILKSYFINVTNLTWLDLSHNNISMIESSAFKGRNITYFKVHHNKFDGLLDDNQFEGINIDELDLSGGKITALGSELFVGQNLRLRVLNFSNNIIFNIKKSSFHNLKLLTELDLSNNKLESINFDTKDLGNLKHYYAKNNLINNITKEMLTNLLSLELLDVSHNVIETIDDRDFVNLRSLKILLLNNNPLLNALKAETFLGLNILSNIYLTYTNIGCLKNETLKGTNSLQTFNASFGNINTVEYNFFYDTGFIKIIDFSHNKIKLFLVNKTNLEQASELYLSSNKLEYISNETFFGLTRLIILKLDNNKIVSIQPGSFAHAMRLRFLNLDNNNLQSFQFGIFDGMASLQDLNLSRNELTSITALLFHKNEKLKTLALDQNFLTNINCFEFNETPIKKLTLGGNLFECAFILNCIKLWNIEITAEHKNYHSENVHGVTCNSQQDTLYVVKTRLAEATNKSASSGMTTQADFNTFVHKMSTLNPQTPDKVTPVSFSTSTSNSAINAVDHHIVTVSLVVIACLLILILSVLSLILYNSHKKHRFPNGYQVNQGDVSLTNRTEIEL